MSRTSVAIPKNDRRTINGWAMFDWANSAYALVITVAIFPAYYAGISDDPVRLVGVDILPETLYGFLLSIAYLIIACLSPVLSGIADYGGRKKFFMRFFTVLGSFACMGLFFFTGVETLALGSVCFVLATIGFAGSLVFYNAFLPEIATEDRYDTVSARGFAFGYVGSILLLLFNLFLFLKHDLFGVSEQLALRIDFLTVGLWWLGWGVFSFSRLPDDVRAKSETGLLKKGFQELSKVWFSLREQRYTQRFLVAFFFYSAGVQTILLLASTFAEVEFSFETQELITVILILQVVAIFGAYLFAKVSAWLGNKRSLMIMLVIWTGLCITGYFITEALQFYFMAAGVGLVMGGVQSMSRSTYSKLLPPQTPDTTSYFSFYDVLEKVSIMSGTFIFAGVNFITGNMRTSVLALAIFFVVGLVVLAFTRIQSARGTSAA